ncbi:MAG TPA: exodeoxyribonuclease VII small subunit [Candidatus Moranbacteria bacterium]|nr:exodeoxyribonuclease VII small subunit [Candidatus Moranbacteria bacterium]
MLKKLLINNLKNMENSNLSESLKKLEAISDWFDNQEEVDVEKGLEKVKEGVELIKLSRARLKEVENEFNDVKKELENNSDEE